jgi:uncharacterized damage-inducible protein DinB
MPRVFRDGAAGALMDEYDRAAAELGLLLEGITDDEFARIVDTETSDEDCRSAQTIMSHVINSGYGYADYIRELFAIPSTRPPRSLPSRAEAIARLPEMLAYSAATFEGRWKMTAEDIDGLVIHSRWGTVYDLEQMMEHAIVHILRHRRQIERFMTQAPRPKL